MTDTQFYWFIAAHAFLLGLIAGWLLAGRGRYKMSKEIRDLKRELDAEIQRNLRMEHH